MKWPFENDTSYIVKLLSKKTLKTEKRRNLMIIIAISLAAFLMSMCGTLFFAFQKSQNSLATFQASYKNVTEEKIKLLRDKPEIKTVGSIYNLENIKMPEGYSIYFSYLDNDALYIARNQVTLKSGNLPHKKEEIVVEQDMIDKYFPNSTIGSIISLKINNSTQKFIISGITETPLNSQNTYTCYISKELLQNTNGYNPSNYQCYVAFKNSNKITKYDLKKNIVLIADEINAKYNFSFLFFKGNDKLPIKNILIFIGLSLIILFAGITVIQSIFRISINEKVRTFGQLRTLGFTSPQIKRMINYESNYLISLGIPPGIIIGSILGTIIGSNKFSSGFSFVNITFIMIIVSIICIVMVKISIYKPLKFAANISPIEAVKYINSQASSLKDRESHKRISPYHLAILNLTRDKKKMYSTLLSLIFGGLLLLISSSVAVTNTPERFIKEKMFKNNGSFRIYLDSDKIQENNPMNKSLENELLNIEGVKRIVHLRDSIGMIQYSINGYGSDNGVCDVMSSSNNEGNYNFISSHLIVGHMPKNSHEVLLTDGYLDLGVKKGSSIRIQINGINKSCVVSGFFDTSVIGTGNSSKNGIEDSSNIIITEKLAKEIFKKKDNFSYAWEIVTNETKNKNIELEISRILASKKLNILVSSYTDNVSYIKSNFNLLFGGLQILSMLILLFGVINLINMTLSNYQSRRHEMYTLCSIGLSFKQLYKSILIEGILYISISFLIILLLGIPISIPITKTVGILIGMQNLPYKFPIIQIATYMILLITIQLVLSFLIVKDFKKYPLLNY